MNYDAIEKLKNNGIIIDNDLMISADDLNDYIKIGTRHLTSLRDEINKLFDNQNGIYRVHFNNGSERLQNSAKFPGRYTGATVNIAGNNNEIVGMATWEKVSESNLLAGNLFNVLSMITGQYYMSEISKKYDSIDRSLSSIMSFLANDKYSKLSAADEYLRETLETWEIIIKNELLRVTSLSKVQEIKIDALSNMDFYKRQIEEFEQIDKKNDSMEVVVDNCEKASAYISKYWYSLYLYCCASNLIILLSGEYSSAYLQHIMTDLKKKNNEFNLFYDNWQNILDDYVETAKAFEDNDILKVLKGIANYKLYANRYLHIREIVMKAGVDFIDKKDKANKDQKKMTSKKFLEMGAADIDVHVLEQKVDEIALLDRINNGEIEIICSENEMYLKVIS